MKSDFWKGNEGRWTIIGLSYVIILGIIMVVMNLVNPQTLGSFSLIIIIVCMVFGWPTATNIVNNLNNAIFGNLILFGPLQMFLQIFLIKLLLRCIIAMCVGPFLLPYNVGKFVANKVAEM